MAKNTDKQVSDSLADNLRGYAVLLRKIKQRVLSRTYDGKRYCFSNCEINDFAIGEAALFTIVSS